jgi:hypothetical protein
MALMLWLDGMMMMMMMGMMMMMRAACSWQALPQGDA